MVTARVTQDGGRTCGAIQTTAPKCFIGDCIGAAGASDYTQNRDPARKQRYLARHAPREHWDRPMTAGALARWLLWNRETLRESLADYLHRFDLTPG